MNMRHLAFVIGCAFIVASVACIVWQFRIRIQAPSYDATCQPLQTPSRALRYIEEIETPFDSFWCGFIQYTESDCRLFVGNASTTVLSDLGIDVDSPSDALLLSPDEKGLLIVLEHTAIVLNTRTLNEQVLATTTPQDAFGTYTSFPQFIPHARWLSNYTASISIFPQYTEGSYRYVDQDGQTHSTPEPKPLAIETFDI
jgi:hypothetical protein